MQPMICTTTGAVNEPVVIIRARRVAGLPACCTAFALGSVAQGAPFVLVAAAFERRGLDPAWLAAIAAIRLLPYLVCSPLSGLFAARYDSRTTLTVAGLGRGALVVLLIAGIRVGAAPAIILVVLFTLVAAGTPTFPALMRSVHHTTPPERRARMSALSAGVESGAFCAGPAFGGLLLVADPSAHLTWALVACAAIAVMSAGIASTLPTLPTPTTVAGGRPVRAAATSLFQPGLRSAVAAAVGVNVLAGIHAALLVRLPAELDLGGERTIGALSFAHGLGAAAAALLVISGSAPHGRRPLLPLVTASTCVALLAATSELPVALVASGLIGASIFTAEVTVIAELGRSVKGAGVAPAFGVLDAALVASMIVGAVLAPALASRLGVRPTLSIAGPATAVLTIGALRASRHSDRGDRG